LCDNIILFTAEGNHRVTKAVMDLKSMAPLEFGCGLEMLTLLF